jgi:hypothetical protein
MWKTHSLVSFTWQFQGVLAGELWTPSQLNLMMQMRTIFYELDRKLQSNNTYKRCSNLYPVISSINFLLEILSTRNLLTIHQNTKLIRYSSIP